MNEFSIERLVPGNLVFFNMRARGGSSYAESDWGIVVELDEEFAKIFWASDGIFSMISHSTAMAWRVER